MPTGPREEIYDPTRVGVYHCYNKCLPELKMSDSFQELVHRHFENLASVFAVDICSAATLINHFHLLVRNRPDLVAQWSDEEVIRRYLTINSKQLYLEPEPPRRVVDAILNDRPTIDCYRQRLSDLPWFMRVLDEAIACDFNRKNQRSGKFWKERYGMQALLTDEAILACSVYIDLNLVRAGIAKTIEESFRSSIYHRIADVPEYLRGLCGLQQPGHVAEGVRVHDFLGLPCQDAQSAQEAEPNPDDEPTANDDSIHPHANEVPPGPSLNLHFQRKNSKWLAPIYCKGDPDPGGEGESLPRASNQGFFDLTDLEYIRLVEGLAKIPHAEKPCFQDPLLPELLERIGVKETEWIEATRTFRQYGRVVGSTAALLNFHQNQPLSGRHFKMCNAAFG